MPRAHSPQGKLEARKNHHHIRGMTQLDLSDEETALLERELRHIVDNHRYHLSPRIVTLREILNKIRPGPVREPLPARKSTRRRAEVAIADDVKGSLRAIGEFW
jgi:hypothetical protein